MKDGLIRPNLQNIVMPGNPAYDRFTVFQVESECKGFFDFVRFIRWPTLLLAKNRRVCGFRTNFKVNWNPETMATARNDVSNRAIMSDFSASSK